MLKRKQDETVVLHIKKLKTESFYENIPVFDLEIFILNDNQQRKLNEYDTYNNPITRIITPFYNCTNNSIHFGVQCMNNFESCYDDSNFMTAYTERKEFGNKISYFSFSYIYFDNERDLLKHWMNLTSPIKQNIMSEYNNNYSLKYIKTRWEHLM